MKTVAGKSYERMWDMLESELVKISSDKYLADHPELNLLASILVGAAKDRDMEYFKSSEYRNHCNLLRLNTVFVACLINKGFKMEDSGQVWKSTDPREEEWEL